MKMDKSSVRILVVDDDQRLLSLLDESLASIGYTTSNVSSGNEALFLLSKKVYDLVITDICMPEMDGLELLNKIRRSYPKLPVILITGVARPEVIAKAHPEGFLTKPFRISHLEAIIEKTIPGPNEKIHANPRSTLVIDDDDVFEKNRPKN